MIATILKSLVNMLAFKLLGIFNFLSAFNFLKF